MEWTIALLVSILTFRLGRALRSIPPSEWGRRLGHGRGTRPASPLPAWRRLLAALGPATTYTPAGWSRAVESHLYWARLAGRWKGWSLAEVLSLHLVLGLLGLVLGTALAPGDALLLLSAALAPPFAVGLIVLRAPARRVRRELAAELPEFVALLPAEVGLGTSLSAAVERLSRGPGVCAAWFRRASEGALGKTLFTTATGHPGTVLAEARDSRDPDLIGLALSLDHVDRRGTGARELLAQTARATAARYAAEAQLRAERVGGEIVLPMIGFFFLPYVVVILLVMAGPLLAGGLFR